MWNLEGNDTNELTYKTERLTNLENELTVAGGRERGRNSQGLGDAHVHTALFTVGSRQGPFAQHRELCSMVHGSLDGSGVGGEWIHVYVWLSPFAAQLKLPQPVNQ